MITTKQINKIIDIVIIIGIIQFVFSVLQVFIRGPFETVILDNVKYMASGLNGNPNFLGSYMTLLLGITISMYFLEQKSNYYLFTSIMFFSTLILAESTGPFLSIVLTVILLVILLDKKKKILWKKVWILFISLILTFITTDLVSEKIFKGVYHDELLSGYTIKGDLLNTLSIFDASKKEDEKQELVENYGSGRFIIWKNTFKIIEKYPWLGTGLDNYGYAYTDIVKPIGFTCDKAHNVYLHIFATNGVFALITYLIILITIFFKGLKSKNNLIIVLLTGFVGYSLQAFLNISVVTVAPFYFIIMGLLVNQIQLEKNN